MAKNGRDVGLIRSADVFFAGYFYSIHCCTRCRHPLKATVNGAPWADLKNKKAVEVRADANVDSDLYWRQSYVVPHTVFLALLALQLADYNKATMDKIHYYTHKANFVIKDNADNLDNTSLFPLQEEDDLAKMGMTTRTLPPRSPAIMGMLTLEMTWMILTSAATQRATTIARMEP